MYYGYHCYNKDGESLGWLYTHNNDTELVATQKYLSWCKRWKTERGAKKNFEHYNSRWQRLSKGGYLKVEIMPDIEETESAESRRQKLLKEWGDNITSSSDTNLNHLLLSTKMFKAKEHMTLEQQTIAEDFVKMVESEYAVCVREIKRANSAIVLSEQNNKNLDFANREIDGVSKYWQLRLGNLIEFIETKNPKLNEELSSKYLSKK